MMAGAVEPPNALPQKGEHSESAQYFEAEDKLVISIDVGNAASSVTLAHLSWGAEPLSPAPASKPCIRTVLTYPYGSPHLGPPTSARVPSLVAFDRAGHPCAFGAECLTEDVQSLVREGTWLLVQGWKEQMRPDGGGTTKAQQASATPSTSTQTQESKRKLLTKLQRPAARPANGSSSASNGRLQLHPVSTRHSFGTLGAVSGYSTSSDGLLDALEASTDVLAEPFEPPTSPRRDIGLKSESSTSSAGKKSAPPSKSSKNAEEAEDYRGPRLRTVYAECLRYLVACARAWYGETVPAGEATFLRLWPTCVFVITTPPDWTSAETDLVRLAVEDAQLLPGDFELGRLFFVKEPTALVHFAKRFVSDKSWCQDGVSFALVDAASAGTTIVGYRVTATSPRFKVKAYDTARVEAGAEMVVEAFRSWLETRLSRTKLKSATVVSHLVQEFREKVLCRFSGGEESEFRLRIHGKDDGTKEWEKMERAIDSGVRIRSGCMTLSKEDVEECFRPVADQIVVRLSSILARSQARHILLFGGFGDSPYLSRRIQEAFSKDVGLLRPEVPSPAAVSEGAMRLYLAETLQPTRMHRAIGVETAVDWSKSWRRGMQDREVVHGSGGTRLVCGTFTPIVQEGDDIYRGRSWTKPFNLKYRLAARKPVFEAALYVHNCSETSSSLDREVWLRDADGSLNSDFSYAASASAELTQLVAELPVFEPDTPDKAWVQLNLQLSIYVGESSLEACVIWQTAAGEHRSEALKLERSILHR
ncbi:hypothetical protein JCM10908_003407 [Rhodotorula pacifica]|uniref:Hsp70 family protein n=1 Tax=Rhodotorula pacifica TaxID=1495444 RepID=UPI00316FD152